MKLRHWKYDDDTIVTTHLRRPLVVAGAEEGQVTFGALVGEVTKLVALETKKILTKPVKPK